MASQLSHEKIGSNLSISEQEFSIQNNTDKNTDVYAQK